METSLEILILEHMIHDFRRVGLGANGHDGDKTCLYHRKKFDNDGRLRFFH